MVKLTKKSFLILMVLMAGCELANEFLVFEDSLTVSKGDYRDEIHLSWSNNFGEGEDAPVSYDIFKDGIYEGTEAVGTSWVDYDVDPGIVYDYHVEGDGRSTDTVSGYAMDAEELLIYSGLWDNPRSDTTGTSVNPEEVAWYHFYAQDGWNYDFYVDNGSGDLSLDLFSRKNIENGLVAPVVVAGSSTGGISGWHCRSSGEYYLRVTALSGTVSFDYCARYRN